MGAFVLKKRPFCKAAEPEVAFDSCKDLDLNWTLDRSDECWIPNRRQWVSYYYRANAVETGYWNTYQGNYLDIKTSCDITEGEASIGVTLLDNGVLAFGLHANQFEAGRRHIMIDRCAMTDGCEIVAPYNNEITRLKQQTAILSTDGSTSTLLWKYSERGNRHRAPMVQMECGPNVVGVNANPQNPYILIKPDEEQLQAMFTHNHFQIPKCSLKEIAHNSLQAVMMQLWELAKTDQRFKRLFQIAGQYPNDFDAEHPQVLPGLPPRDMIFYFSQDSLEKLPQHIQALINSGTKFTFENNKTPGIMLTVVNGIYMYTGPNIAECNKLNQLRGLSVEIKTSYGINLAVDRAFGNELYSYEGQSFCCISPNYSVVTPMLEKIKALKIAAGVAQFCLIQRNKFRVNPSDSSISASDQTLQTLPTNYTMVDVDGWLSFNPREKPSDHKKASICVHYDKILTETLATLGCSLKDETSEKLDELAVKAAKDGSFDLAQYSQNDSELNELADAMEQEYDDDVDWADDLDDEGSQVFGLDDEAQIGTTHDSVPVVEPRVLSCQVIQQSGKLEIVTMPSVKNQIIHHTYINVNRCVTKEYEDGWTLRTLRDEQAQINSVAWATFGDKESIQNCNEVPLNAKQPHELFRSFVLCNCLCELCQLHLALPMCYGRRNANEHWSKAYRYKLCYGYGNGKLNGNDLRVRGVSNISGIRFFSVDVNKDSDIQNALYDVLPQLVPKQNLYLIYQCITSYIWNYDGQITIFGGCLLMRILRTNSLRRMINKILAPKRKQLNVNEIKLRMNEFPLMTNRFYLDLKGKMSKTNVPVMAVNPVAYEAEYEESGLQEDVKSDLPLVTAQPIFETTPDRLWEIKFNDVLKLAFYSLIAKIKYDDSIILDSLVNMAHLGITPATSLSFRIKNKELLAEYNLVKTNEEFLNYYKWVKLDPLQIAQDDYKVLSDHDIWVLLVTTKVISDYQYVVWRCGSDVLLIRVIAQGKDKLQTLAYLDVNEFLETFDFGGELTCYIPL